ncbi:MAG: DUF4286 family protein [Bacteroidales bacterium]|nr:DUF4286 family protein [Bacteroidales bacterium]
MIVFNTTYHIEKEIEEEVLRYITGVYIPAVIDSGRLSEPRLCRILGASDEDEGGESYSLQFEAGSIDELEEWYAEQGLALHKALISHFGDRVAAFATLLQPVILE